MATPRQLQFVAVLQRKDPRLPVFVVVPHAQVEPWSLAATTVVEVTVNGHEAGRRTLKRWDSSPRADWFVEFTAPFCRTAGIDPGDKLWIDMQLARTDVPPELEVLLADNQALSAWSDLSTAGRRSIMEHVQAAKSPATRERRAAQAIERLLASKPAP